MSHEATARGLIELRGIIHAHSYYSHDACDDEPIKNGVYDEVCFDDLRRGLCQSQHDFLMLSDHSDSFAENEFPDVLLYREDRGDRLIERNGRPVANRAGCPEGTDAVIMAGTESGTMPVGLEYHIESDITARYDLYDSTSSTAIMRFKEAGAVALVQHTEDWTVEQLSDLPLDGFEMYNLHANMMMVLGTVLELIVLNDERPHELPHPDLLFAALWREDQRYLERWGSVLARGNKRVTTMATDVHRNSFRAILPDGERGDSYRRMMIWLSNHLLVKPDADGGWTDLEIKEAVRSGRLYGAFEAFGYPVGFDFLARTNDAVVEMGGEVSLQANPTLEVIRPAVRDLDSTRTAPTLTVRLLRAVEGGFEEVAKKEGDLTFQPTLAGAYRAEVRMVPHHLKEDLGKYAADLRDADLVWVYSNPIFVR